MPASEVLLEEASSNGLCENAIAGSNYMKIALAFIFLCLLAITPGDPPHPKIEGLFLIEPRASIRVTCQDSKAFYDVHAGLVSTITQYYKCKRGAPRFEIKRYTTE